MSGDSLRSDMGGRRTTAGYQVDGGVRETLREDEALGHIYQSQTKVEEGNERGFSQILGKEC